MHTSSSQFRITPLEQLNGLCTVTAIGATLPNKTHFSKLSDWIFKTTSKINVNIKLTLNSNVTPAIPLTPLCIAKGERLSRDFPLSVAVITRYRGYGPVEVPSSST